jgi:alpha-glucosidase
VPSRAEHRTPHARGRGPNRVLTSTRAAVRIQAGDALLELTALAPDVFRLGYFPHGRPVEYASEASDGAEWEPVDAEIHGESGRVEIDTAAAKAVVTLEPLRVSFADRDGTALVDDVHLWSGEPDPDPAALIGPPVRMDHARTAHTRFFGCGERTSGLEKTASRQVFWNIDPPGGHGAAHNNLYTSIPFVLALCDGRAHGVFLDNTHRVEIDLAKADPERVSYEATGGDVVAYVFTGPTPRDVLARYTQLTGRMSLPPLWALGNHQSRWGYASAEEILGLAREFRERDIPCDCFHIDIEYMDGYRVFTWDAERYPDPAGLLSELAEQGFRAVTIVDPGVKVDEGYAVYTEGRERGLFCQTVDGDEYRNAVWPGVCAFPDFTNPDTRRWWGDHHNALLDAGVAGIWCDMDEPALFIPFQSTMPEDVVHPGKAEPRLHGQVHNLYGSQMARAAREGLERLRPDRRPFVITRAGFAGLQRHAMQWTGDNSSWWEHLWMAIPQLQNLGLSGVAFCGVDVGGFYGDTNPELLTRWTELGIVQPFCRNHSHIESVPQEPWRFGEPWTGLIRKSLELRMRLLPYLYGAFEECSRTGAPILRPLLFDHPGDETTYTTDDELLLGDALLVAPITRPGSEHRHVYLPEGTWVHWWSGERIAGPAHVLAHAPLGRPALYARANAAIPLWPVMQSTASGPPPELRLRIACAPGAGAYERELYEDAGEGFGASARRSVRCDGTRIELGERRGDYVPPAREAIELELRGVEPGTSVRVDGEPAEAREEDGALVVALEESPAARVVQLG